MSNLSIVIPVFNAEGALAELYERIIRVAPSLKSEIEILMIDDGSKDGSWEVIQRLAQKDRRIKGIQLAKNFGQHNALLCGIRAATGEIIITMDDDLQNPPEEIPKLLEKLNEGFDVVYGTPDAEQHSLWRDTASRLTKTLLQTTMGVETARQVSAFRIFRAWLRDSFAHYQDSFISIDVLLTWGTNRFAAVTTKHDLRVAGQSNYTFGKLVYHALNMFTGFSTLPLRLASVMGFTLTLFGMGILVYVIGRFLIYGSVVPGFPFLASIIAIFSGAQLFALGILGEYMARVHFRTMAKPSYNVRTTTFK
jgi:glycosyltransferase involved in cell wall biosynthesis